MTWVKLGLQDVLYDPKTQRIYTPNTNQMTTIEESDSALSNENDNDILEARGNDKHDPKSGRFASKGGGSGNRKMRSRNNKNSGPARMSAAERTRISHQIATDMPELKADGTVYSCFNRKYYYTFTVAETGAYTFQKKIKIEGNEKRIVNRKEG